MFALRKHVCLLLLQQSKTMKNKHDMYFDQALCDLLYLACSATS